MELKSNQKVLMEIGTDVYIKSAISVIIPCYNYGKYLGEAIESVTAQTREPIEIIVMDDASTDNTSEVAKSFPVRYVRNPRNLGASENFNLGIRLARGEYILHLDADDRLRPEFLRKH
jgi:glycosyltransferase involved in cell wall biosynthesis